MIANRDSDPCATDSSFLTPSLIALQQHHLLVSSQLETAEISRGKQQLGTQYFLLLSTTSNISPEKPLNKGSTSSGHQNISPALTDAITKGNLRLCQQLIERGFSIDGTCDCGCTALVKACAHNRPEVATYLLEIGASVNGKACGKESYKAGYSAVQLAALNGDFELFESIFRKAPFVAAEAMQAFQHAARRGHVTILRFLLQHATDKKSLLEAGTPEVPDVDNEHLSVSTEVLDYSRPLHLAVTHGHFEAIEVLLRAGADLEARDEDGMTALQLAVESREHREILDFLITAGANINTRDYEGLTPLMRAAREYSRLRALRRLMSMTKNGLDLQATDKDGSTALHHAVTYDNSSAAKLLIKAGLDPLRMDLLGNSAIKIALEQYNIRFVVKNLPEFDNVRSKLRLNILHTAVYIGDEGVVSELLQRAPEKDVEDYVNLPCDMGTPLYCAAYRGSIPIMEKLIGRGAQVNLVGGTIGSPLIAACAMGHVQAAIWLLRKGAELQYTKLDGTTITAEEAAQQHEAVIWLLKRFKEKGLEGLDDKIPIKTANISKLDEFMATYEKRKTGHSMSRSGSGDFSDQDSDGSYYSDSDSDVEKEDEKVHVKDTKTEDGEESAEKGEANTREASDDDKNLDVALDKAAEV